MVRSRYMFMYGLGEWRLGASYHQVGYLLCFIPVVVVIDCSIYLSPDTYNPMRTNGNRINGRQLDVTQPPSMPPGRAGRSIPPRPTASRRPTAGSWRRWTAHRWREAAAAAVAAATLLRRPPPRQPMERPEGNDDGFLGGGISGSLLGIVLGGGGTARRPAPSRPPNLGQYQWRE